MAEIEIFVVSTGVSGNLGDAVIRRRVLRWVEGLGTRHVYVGGTTPGWLEQLQLDDDDVVYTATERRRWLRKLLFGRGRRALVYDPGEVPLGRAHLKSEVVFLLINLWLRLRGSYVFRPPRAVAHRTWAVATLHRLACLLSDTVMWRDEESHRVMRCGDLAPDTAFDEPDGPFTDQARDRLVVSLRGRRPPPPQAFFAGVQRFADSRGLRVTLVTQVDEDEARSVEMASTFDGCELVDWGTDGDLAREERSRAVYARTHTVISDRLHVLLLAARAGAMPREVVLSPAPKIRTHFATAGVSDISVDLTGLEAHDVFSWLDSRADRAGEDHELMVAARGRLQARVQEIRAGIAGRVPARRP